MREKYRSAVYTYSAEQAGLAQAIINSLQPQFDNQIITKVLPLESFKENNEEYLDYYYSNPEEVFCQTYINPKLRVLLTNFSAVANQDKLGRLLPN
jgi:peptide-methionine (S)-S-oxide reductase